MRIVGIRIEPLAGVLAVAYAIFGLSAFVFFANYQSNIFLCVAAVLSYAITGWITGVVAALCFNAVAKLTGGIDAKYFSTIIKENTPNPAL